MPYSRSKVLDSASLSFDSPEMHREVLYRPHPSLLPPSTWTPPRAHELPTWDSRQRVCIDVECRDPDLLTLGPGCRRKGSYVVGICLAFEDGKDFYLPIRHDGGDNCEWDAWQYVQDQLRTFTGTLVVNGGDYDLDWLCQPDGVGGPSTDVSAPWLQHGRMRIADVQVAGVMINELEDRYNLDALCGRLGLPGKDETLLNQVAGMYRADPKSDLWRFPARYVAPYGMADARRPLQVLRRQEPILAEEGVESIWRLEEQVTPICVKMRRRGVRIDPAKLAHVEERSLTVEAEMLARVAHRTGVQIAVGDVWKAEVLAHALRAAGYAPSKTDVGVGKNGRPTGGKDSVDKAFLSKCGDVGSWLLRARAWNKLRTTFVMQVRKHLVAHGGDAGLRAHCTFHQLRRNSDASGGDEGGRGVRYGRFSSTDFNVQQQPARDDEFGELWRSVYVPDASVDGEEAEWVCSDWSQQEPRIGVHYAEALNLPGAREFADAYRANPRLDVHQKLADLTQIVRKICKNFVNGLLYGMGDAKLCRSIGKPTEWREIRGEMREVAGPEAQAIIDQFERFAPWLRALVRAVAKRAEKVGHVWTILRRKCRFEKVGGKYDRTHKAMSRVGQGGAADQMKATLVAADREGIPVQMVVHDEFDYSEAKTPAGKRRRRRLKELQLTVVTFSVPMLVDQETGPSWGELTKDEEVN